jgi:hypothetical protein
MNGYHNHQEEMYSMVIEERSYQFTEIINAERQALGMQLQRLIEIVVRYCISHHFSIITMTLQLMISLVMKMKTGNILKKTFKKLLNKKQKRN